MQDMSQVTEALYQIAMTLPETERVSLADRILDSVSPEEGVQLHPAWKEEIRRRLAQIDSGEVTPIPWEEVKRRAWEALELDSNG
jgi:putative addiction module component (TIGR02574 family)